MGTEEIVRRINEANGLKSGAGLGACAPKAPRPLDRISAAADRVERASQAIKAFCERFEGPFPEADPRVEPPSCYRTELDRLSFALDALEAHISALNDIG